MTYHMLGIIKNTSCKIITSFRWELLRVLFEKRPALYFCNYEENKKNNTRMLDTLFIEDFIDSMEEYFHFYNHNNWQ